MVKPNYLSLRYYLRYVRDTGDVQADPMDLLNTQLLKLQARYPDDRSWEFLMEIYKQIEDPHKVDPAKVRDFDEAEERFLNACWHVATWDLPRLNNELGKAGTCLGLRVPFLF